MSTLFAVMIFGGVARGADPLTVSSNRTINENMTVSKIVFTGGFALSGSGTITIEAGGGITVPAGASATVKAAASIANPVVFNGTDAQLISLGTNASLDQTGIWSGTAPLSVEGGAMDSSLLNLRGNNTFKGVLKSLGKCSIHAYADTAFGTTDGTTDWDVRGGSDGTKIYLHSGTYAETMRGFFKTYDKSVQIPQGETVTLSGTLSLSGTGYLVVGEDATLNVSGTLNGPSWFTPTVSEGGILRFKQDSTLSWVCFNPGGDGTIEFERSIPGSGSDQAYSIGGSVTFKMMAENAVNANSNTGGQIGGNAIWDLNGLNQNGGRCRGGTDTATVKSERAATLTYAMGVDSVVNANRFTGAVSVAKSGNGELTLSSSMNDSTGTLTVSGGGLALDATGTWTGDVLVKNGAVLTIVGNKTVGDVVVEEGGKIILDGDVNTGAITFGSGPAKPRGRAYDATTDGQYIEGSGRLISFDEALTVSADMDISEDRFVSAVNFTGGYRLYGAGKLHVTGSISVPSGTATIENAVEFAGSSQVTLTVGTDGVLVQTGVWSGKAPLYFVGAGSGSNTHRFELRGANIFDGSITMLKARIDAYNGKSFGSAVGDTALGSVGGTNGSQLNFHGGDYTENFTAGNVTFSGWWKPVTISEGINIFRGKTNFGVPHYQNFGEDAVAVHVGSVGGGGNSNYCPSPSVAGSVLVLTNGFTCNFATFNPGGVGRTGGSVLLYASIDKQYALNAAYVVAKTENAFNCASKGGYIASGAYVDLNGFDQEGGYFSDNGNMGGTFYSEDSATWKCRMGTHVQSVPYIFEGAASLEKYGTGTLTLTGVSTTSGDLRVKEGDVTLSEDGTWAGRIQIDASATLTTVGNREVGTLEIADGGVLVLGGRLVAQSVTVGGKPLEKGRVYSKSAGDTFIEGDGALVMGGEAVVLTWTAGGADDLITTPENWGHSGSVDLESGYASAVFATAGTCADVNRSVAFSGVTFDCETFRLIPAAENALLALGVGGLNIRDGALVRHYDIAVPVAFREPAAITGLGQISLMKGGDWESKVAITNTDILLSGEHRLSKDISIVGVENSNPRLYLSNAVIRASSTSALISIANGERKHPVDAVTGTTNVVETAFNISTVTRPHFEADSQTTFSGGCNWGTFCVPYIDNNAHLIIENKTLSAYDFNPVAGVDSVVSFRVADNRIYNANYGSFVTVPNGLTLRLEVSDAFRPSDNTRFNIVKGGTIDLCGNDQHIGPLHDTSAAGGAVISDVAATLFVNQTEVIRKNATSTTGPLTNDTCFAGLASLSKGGELKLSLSGVSTSSGMLAVTRGELAFVKDGSWKSASSVLVTGGTLVLDRRGRIAKTASVSVDGGVINIAAGVSQSVGGLTLGGVVQPRGRSYGSTSSKADVKDDRYFSGDGMILNYTPGLFLVVQ